MANETQASAEEIKNFIEKNPGVITDAAFTVMLGIVVGHMKQTMKEEEIRATFEAAILS